MNVPPKEKISKFDAATSQLETAIKLFFEGRDILSAYTLCCAADGILEGLWKEKREALLISRGLYPAAPPPSQQSIRELWDDYVIPEHKSEAFMIINRTQNFLKHADRDPNDTHEYAPFEETSLRLFFTCRNHCLISGEESGAISTFIRWFAVFYPNLLNAGCDLRRLIEENTPSPIPNADKLLVGLKLLKTECPELFNDQQSSMRKRHILRIST